MDVVPTQRASGQPEPTMPAQQQEQEQQPPASTKAPARLVCTAANMGLRSCRCDLHSTGGLASGVLGCRLAALDISPSIHDIMWVERPPASSRGPTPLPQAQPLFSARPSPELARTLLHQHTDPDIACPQALTHPHHPSFSPSRWIRRASRLGSAPSKTPRALQPSCAPPAACRDMPT